MVTEQLSEAQRAEVIAKNTSRPLLRAGTEFAHVVSFLATTKRASLRARSSDQNGGLHFD